LSSVFTLKTVITDVFVVQVYWEAVLKTWPGGSKASVKKCVVRPWNSTPSAGGRDVVPHVVLVRSHQ